MGVQWLGEDEHTRLHKEGIAHHHDPSSTRTFDLVLTLAGVLAVAATIFVIIYLLNTGSQ